MILLLTGLWHGDSKSAGKDALLLHTFTGTSLACYKSVCFWWLCMLSFLSFFVFLGGSGNLKQEGAEGAERLHPYRQKEKECH